MFDLVEPLLGLTFLGSVVGGVLYAQRRRIARLSVEPSRRGPRRPIASASPWTPTMAGVAAATA